MDNQRKTNGATRELNHPAFQNIRICLVSIYDRDDETTALTRIADTLL